VNVDAQFTELTPFVPYDILLSADIDGNGSPDAKVAAGMINSEAPLTDLGVPKERPPSTVDLIGAWPNPFHRLLTVELALPKAGAVQLELYDVGGRRVRRVVRENVAAGRGLRVLDAAGLPSGLYLLRVETEGMVRTRRVVLLGRDQANEIRAPAVIVPRFPEQRNAAAVLTSTTAAGECGLRLAGGCHRLTLDRRLRHETELAQKGRAVKVDARLDDLAVLIRSSSQHFKSTFFCVAEMIPWGPFNGPVWVPRPMNSTIVHSSPWITFVISTLESGMAVDQFSRYSRYPLRPVNVTSNATFVHFTSSVTMESPCRSHGDCMHRNGREREWHYPEQSHLISPLP
jgi:hypothetical protein